MELIETRVKINDRVLKSLIQRMPILVKTAALAGANKGRDLVKLGIEMGSPEWPPLKDQTVQIKGHDQILYDKGDMYDSIRATSTKQTEASYYTDIWYAAIHEWGLAEGVPKREFFLPTVKGSELKEITRAVEHVFTSGLKL